MDDMHAAEIQDNHSAVAVLDNRFEQDTARQTFTLMPGTTGPRFGASSDMLE